MFSDLYDSVAIMARMVSGPRAPGSSRIRVSKYKPHQGKREIARRQRQEERRKAKQDLRHFAKRELILPPPDAKVGFVMARGDW